MLATLVHRLSTRPAAPQSAVPDSTRLAVCPPSQLNGESSRWQRALRRALGQAADQAACDPQALQQAREDFTAGLEGLDGQHADFLRSRGLRARSLLELWYLRTEVFQLVAVQRSQHEAVQRLARLNRHFPTRAPRSRFAPADF